MLNNIMMNKLGATKHLKRKLHSMESLEQCTNESNIYDNGIEELYKSDLFLVAGTMNVDYYTFTYKLYKNGKLFFYYCGEGNENTIDAEYDNCIKQLEKAINDILRPCKPSSSKIHKLSNMTVENGCTEAEALNATIMLNKLLLRSLV